MPSGRLFYLFIHLSVSHQFFRAFAGRRRQAKIAAMAKENLALKEHGGAFSRPRRGVEVPSWALLEEDWILSVGQRMEVFQMKWFPVFERGCIPGAVVWDPSMTEGQMK